MKPFRIIYHCGDELTLRTKVKSGRLADDNGILTIVPRHEQQTIALGAIRSVELFMMNGIGSCLKIRNGDSTIFISVVRFCIAGQFSVVNMLGTRKLKALLEARIL